MPICLNVSMYTKVNLRDNWVICEFRESNNGSKCYLEVDVNIG